MARAETSTGSLTDRAQKIALAILKGYPNGLGTNELKRKIVEQDPRIKFTTAGYAVWTLQRDPDLITKTAMNTVVLTELTQKAAQADLISSVQEVVNPLQQTPAETQFYDPFARWLAGPADEATEAVALGGSGLKKKWGTPDVVGIYKPRASDLVKFAPILIAAEVKIDPRQSITAFGQAISYRLFSHKSFVVMPRDIIEKFSEDHDRLMSLCELFGVGYVLFDPPNKEDPNFEVIVRARSFEPDMAYVNIFATSLRNWNQSKFDRLFQ